MASAGFPCFSFVRNRVFDFAVLASGSVNKSSKSKGNTTEFCRGCSRVLFATLGWVVLVYHPRKFGHGSNSVGEDTAGCCNLNSRHSRHDGYFPLKRDGFNLANSIISLRNLKKTIKNGVFQESRHPAAENLNCTRSNAERRCRVHVALVDRDGNAKEIGVAVRKLLHGIK